MALTAGSTNAAIIAGWTFETAPPADLADNVTIAGIAADNGSGTASGVHASALTDWTTPSGNGSANSLSSNNWAIGDYYQFEVSTTGFEDFIITWDQTSSGTGPGVFDLEYRIGNAGTFTTVLDNYVVLPNQAGAPGAGSWGGTAIPAYSYSVDLSAVSALDNQTLVQFRLTMATADDAAPPGTVAVAGTSRVDNFVVNGTVPVPEPGTIALGTLAGLGFLGYRLRRKQS